MEKQPNVKCPCPNKNCELHGRCKECRASHHGKSAYCQLSPFKKKVNNFICKLIVR